MIPIISSTAGGAIPDTAAAAIFQMDAGHFLDALPQQEIFDLIVTSPPYNNTRPKHSPERAAAKIRS